MRRQKHGAERVAIVDWDVHHGNGTQDIFWDDPSVLYCSTHQMPLYPGTGAKDETGAGNIVNAPLAPGTGSDLFREAFQSRVLPALDDFPPDLIIISAGFDAHHRDPLAEINLTEDDFDWATGQLMERAARHCRRPARQPARRRLRSAGTGIFGRRPCRPPDEGMSDGRRSRTKTSRR